MLLAAQTKHGDIRPEITYRQILARLTERLDSIDCAETTLGYLTKNQVFPNLLPITGLHRPIQGIASAVHRFDPAAQVDILTGLI